MSKHNGLIDFTGRYIAETDRGILFDDGTQKVWFPKSRIEYEQNRDGTYTVTLPYKLAMQKGII